MWIYFCSLLTTPRGLTCKTIEIGDENIVALHELWKEKCNLFPWVARVLGYIFYTDVCGVTWQIMLERRLILIQRICHYLSLGRGGKGSEGLSCVTVKLTWSPIRLCKTLMIPPFLLPPPTLFGSFLNPPLCTPLETTDFPYVPPKKPYVPPNLPPPPPSNKWLVLPT